MGPIRNINLAFITNENTQSLKYSLEILIKDTSPVKRPLITTPCLRHAGAGYNRASFFDCLVGYFYTSGFYASGDCEGKTIKVKYKLTYVTNSTKLYI